MRGIILRLLRLWRGSISAVRQAGARISARVAQQQGRQGADPAVKPSSSDPVAALLPVPVARTGEGAPIPSKARLSRHRRLVWTRRGMVFCLCAALVCVLSVPVLAAFRVRRIDMKGISHYTEQDILSIADVSVGEELFAVSPAKIEAALRESCPYLSEVDVGRGLGRLTITVVECVPRWALLTADGRAALLTEDLYVPEVCAADAVPQDVCVLSMPLPLLEPTEEDGEPQPQQPKAGAHITGSSSALALLDRMEAALNGVVLPSQPALLDLSDLYAVTLTLADDTVISLHECSAPARQIKSAATAIAAYRSSYPAGESILYVDVDDFSHVSIRAAPKIVEENGD